MKYDITFHTVHSSIYAILYIHLKGANMLSLLQLIDTPDDKRRFEELYSRYERLLFVVANDVLKDPHKAEDAVNDAFVNIINNFEKISDITSPRTKRFVVIVVRNICFNILKKEKRRPEILSEEPDVISSSASAAEDSFFDSYDGARIKEKIGMLPAAQRDALYLYIVENLTVSEISDLLGCSYETVKKRISRGKKKLREMMECEDE